MELKKQNGFSLIEVIVAVGLLSIVSLALMAVLDSTNKNQKRALNRDHLLNVGNQIRSTLTDTALCRQAFVFNIGNSISFPAAPTVNTNYALNRVTALGRDFFLTNAPIPGALDVSTPPTSAVSGIRLRLGNSSVSATPGYTNWDAILTIPLVVTNQTAMKDIIISFLLTTEDINPTTVFSCNAMTGGATTDKMVCENIMGGVYNVLQTPQCRLQQTLVSPLKFRNQLGSIPAGSFLAVDTPLGSRGLASFGAGAKLGLYVNETDFTTSPNNGVELSIPVNNQLQIEAKEGIISNGYVQINRDATGPLYAMRVFNSVMGLNVFNLDRTGRLSANTSQVTAWNNFGPNAGLGDILRIYNNASVTEVVVDSNGNVGIGPNAGTGKLDVRGNAVGPVINWGLALSPLASLVVGAGFTGITAVSDFRIQTNGGSNLLTFNSTDAVFTRNVNAPTFNNVSDARLKRDIKKLGSTLEKLITLQSYTYIFKNDSENIKHYGFLAQEILNSYPNLVHTNQDGYYSVNYIELIPLITEALKETAQKNWDLEVRLRKIEMALEKIQSNSNKHGETSE
mgnify:CR=1 FL=1